MTRLRDEVRDRLATPATPPPPNPRVRLLAAQEELEAATRDYRTWLRGDAADDPPPARAPRDVLRGRLFPEAGEA